MSLFPIRLLAAFPCLEGYRQILVSFAEQGGGKICPLEERLGSTIAGLSKDMPHLEVVSAQDLSASCLLLSNQKFGPICPDKQVSEYVQLLLDDGGNLGPFEQVREFPGIHRRLCSALEELRWWRVDAGHKAATVGSLDPVSRTKLAVLGSIEQRLAELIGQRNEERLVDRLERCLLGRFTESGSNQRVLFFVGPVVSKLQTDWIHWCSQQGMEVWVASPYSEELRSLWNRTQALASELGATPEIVGVAPPLPSQYASGEIAPNPIQVRIESAADDLSECEWALRRVAAELGQGARISEIGIFVRNLTGYGPLLLSCAKRMGVPLALHTSVTLSSFQITRWTIKLLKALSSSSPLALLEVVESTYAGLSLEQQETVRSIILDCYRHDESAWKRMFEQLSANPFWLAAWIDRFRAKMDEPAQERDWLELLLELLSLPPFFSEDGDGLSDVSDRLAHAEMAAALTRRLNTLSARSKPVSLSRFATELEKRWNSASVDMAPEGQGVLVTSSVYDLLGKRCVHVLSMIEGQFPRRRQEDPILSDWERKCLTDESDLLPFPTSEESSPREMELFVTLLGAPTERLSFSYPVSDDARDNVPAFFLERTALLLEGSAVKVHHPRGKWVPDAQECILPFDERLSAALQSPMDPVTTDTIKDRELLEILRSKPGDALGIRDLRNAYTCPFRFAASKSLRLSPRRPLRPLSKLPLEILSRAESPESAIEQLNRALDHDIEEARPQVGREQLALLVSAAKRRIRDAVASEFKSRQTWQRDPASIRHSVSFGDEQLPSVFPLGDGDQVIVQGTVASLGTMGPYRTATVFGARSSLMEGPTKWTAEEEIEAGVYLAALGTGAGGRAVEFCSSEGARLLVCSEIVPGHVPKNSPGDQLSVKSLDARESKFFSRLKEHLKIAVRNAKNLAMEATPGQHCRFCAYGEICRRSSETGEQMDVMNADE